MDPTVETWHIVPNCIMLPFMMRGNETNVAMEKTTACLTERGRLHSKHNRRIQCPLGNVDRGVLSPSGAGAPVSPSLARTPLATRARACSLTESRSSLRRGCIVRLSPRLSRLDIDKKPFCETVIVCSRDSSWYFEITADFVTSIATVMSYNFPVTLVVFDI